MGERGLVPLTVHAALSVGVVDALPPANIRVSDAGACAAHSGPSLVLRRESVVNGLHFLSSGAVSFARGLNDAPKIVGLLVVLDAIHLQVSLSLIAAVMAIGGLVHARKGAETVSRRITPMSHGEGLVANLVTSLLVLTASHSGLPVSTTHVSCSSIFGMGLVRGKADQSVIRKILISWVLTLPLAALLAALAAWVFRW